jgi:medium-chain acyl-[acyl-carrier-protein] hydrolase
MAALRMFCFPYAGVGLSAFRGWWDEVDPDIEVCCIQTPGRENRIHERPVADISELAQAIAANLAPWLDRPYVFYGHSLGALIAFEVARALRKEMRPAPEHLLVSASRAPHLPWPHLPVHQLSDLDLLAEVNRRYDSVPRQILEDRELRDLVVPALRADFALIETYRYVDGAPLQCPISAFGGQHDSTVSAASLDAWRHQTCTAFRLRMLPANHLFLNRLRRELLYMISAALKHGRGAAAV